MEEPEEEKNRVAPRWELMFTVFIILISCCGIGVTISRGLIILSSPIQLTMENYNDYLHIYCQVIDSPSGSGDTVHDCMVNVSARNNCTLEYVYISYSLTCNNSDLYNGTIMIDSITLTTGHSYMHMDVIRDKVLPENPTVDIKVTSITGNYKRR